jgi:hypothetical protein
MWGPRATAGHPNSYQSYEGTPLKKTTTQEGSAPSDRGAYLLSQRAAVLP